MARELLYSAEFFVGLIAFIIGWSGIRANKKVDGFVVGCGVMALIGGTLMTFGLTHLML